MKKVLLSVVGTAIIVLLVGFGIVRSTMVPKHMFNAVQQELDLIKKEYYDERDNLLRENEELKEELNRQVLLHDNTLEEMIDILAETDAEEIELSDELLEVILLARSYYDNFSSAKNFVEIDNQLFHDYQGGAELKIDEFKNFISKMKGENSYKHYLEETSNNEDFIINSRGFDDFSYVLKADIDNDGVDEIFIGSFDTGSLYNAWNTVYKRYGNHYDVLIEETQYTIYRIVSHKGRNFLFLPLPNVYEAEKYGFDIIYFGDNGIERCRIFGDKIEKQLQK